MNKSVKNVLVLLIVISVVYFGNRAVQSYLGQQALEALPFPVYSLEEGKQKAKQSDKLILADYSAIWCPNCRKLDQRVFSHPDIADTVKKNFSYVRVDFDSDEGQAFAEKFKLMGFPRVLVLSANGDKIVEMPLVFDPKTYNDNLQKVIAIRGN
ncbi:thioredoxin family protein [Agaribacter marinus]|uniref:Thioredoxin domain-containing protein n=1 Tax=Agaribacter marinus TaxID=1431249 RepID=A0AA37WJN4_9ALTE|nr:thioredoxin family protein [Agaribacter marinus]GLR72438.1 hypothetical protein GCM10007852_33460 [Agaribacter marinus]